MGEWQERARRARPRREVIGPRSVHVDPRPGGTRGGRMARLALHRTCPYLITRDEIKTFPA